MLNNCKISKYKIKKILKCFVEDCTSTEASEFIKLNRKTINRYYNVFRQITVRIIVRAIKKHPTRGEYIGCMKGVYGPKNCFKIYKLNKKIFVHTKLSEKTDFEKNAIEDQDFEQYLTFFYKRLAKFHGFTEHSYHYQLYECICRYNFSNEDLFNLIWKNLLLKTPAK